jgi:hypothetical protein
MAYSPVPRTARGVRRRFHTDEPLEDKPSNIVLSFARISNVFVAAKIIQLGDVLPFSEVHHTGVAHCEMGSLASPTGRVSLLPDDEGS